MSTCLGCRPWISIASLDDDNLSACLGCHLRLLHSIFPILTATSIWVSQLHCKKKQKKNLIINLSTDIRSDFVLFNYFLTLQQIPIAFVNFLLLQQTHPINPSPITKHWTPFHQIVPHNFPIPLAFPISPLSNFLSIGSARRRVTNILWASEAKKQCEESTSFDFISVCSPVYLP